MNLKHILDGYKVLDFTHALAGPTTTRLMAEMGADIVKVELPPVGDMSRLLPIKMNGRTSYFVQQNRGKKSICVNLKTPEGRAIIHDLIKQVDVVVENFSPGVAERLGIGWETVKTLNPRAVMCSISALGQQGPLSELPGFDYIAQAYSGITSMIGETDGTPYIPPVGLGDVGTGVHAALAVLAAAQAGDLRLPPQLLVHRHMCSLDLPRRPDGSPAACLHPALQHRDWWPLQPGDPVFTGPGGETIGYVPPPGLECQPVWPVFVNEAAYGEKGIALSLTCRESWPVSAEWQQALTDLASQLAHRGAPL